jgi:hypothetical protein
MKESPHYAPRVAFNCTMLVGSLVKRQVAQYDGKSPSFALSKSQIRIDSARWSIGLPICASPYNVGAMRMAVLITWRQGVCVGGLEAADSTT